ncbi:P-loop containing nucleoside triphosphate hydrolase protein [Pelagophyceae sp. CCMP2097]|nr:P-loop containing nucleoside triphosphate hydrolase protein [Pelagophyceae sp. CCMP2097]|mmetsp:Transcript_11022/g.38283  ORF Transcript_11022/g.38283 Transcript_11022/m.38283 type:complete len:487 (-) Transcript_11022:101-1561(-)
MLRPRWLLRCGGGVPRRRVSGIVSTWLWPKPESPEFLALSRRPKQDEEVPKEAVVKPVAEPNEPHDADPFASEAAREAFAVDVNPDLKVDPRMFTRDPVDPRTPAQFTGAPISVLPADIVEAAPVSAAPVVPVLSARAKKMAAFRMTPYDVKAALDKQVVGQIEAKKAIAVAIAEHFHHARRCLEDESRRGRQYHKKNILLVGPSGCGKTQLLRAVANLVDAPLVKADATKFSATGYVGGDVDSLVQQLFEAADGDASSAEFGIIYIDEVDKICDRPQSALFAGGGAGGVNTRDVQTALLKLMEDAELPMSKLTTKKPMKQAGETFSTKNVLWVFSGAFESLTRGGEVATTPTARDFVDAGLLHEFVGRIPVRVALSQLTVDQLVEILEMDSDLSPLHQYVDSFLGHGISLTFEREALQQIAQRAFDHRLGARGLVTELEATLRDFAYHLPSCSSVERLHLDVATVLAPEAALEAILRQHPPTLPG